MTKEELFLALGKIEDQYIEASEEGKQKTGKRKAASIVLAAALIVVFSVTAAAAAGFFNTMNGGKLVFMEALGGYGGDTYNIRINVDVAEDAEYEIKDYYVPMYLEENWTDCGGEADEYFSVLVYDNYDENLYAIFTQYPAANYRGGENSVGYSVPAETEILETYFEIDGEKLYCLEIQPGDDGFRGDPYGDRIVFWSDGYNLFILDTRLTMSEEVLRDIIRSVKKVNNISDYVKYAPRWEE